MRQNVAHGHDDPRGPGVDDPRHRRLESAVPDGQEVVTPDASDDLELDRWCDPGRSLEAPARDHPIERNGVVVAGGARLDEHTRSAELMIRCKGLAERRRGTGGLRKRSKHGNRGY